MVTTGPVGESGEGCRGWYRPSSPPPGNRIAVRPEAPVTDGPGDLNSFAFQFGEGGVDVITHEIELR
jgi:hypothetical protein